MAYEKEKKTAVALEYTPGEQAPKVIASGRGYLADKIIDVANIPQELYSIVAEVLVFVDDMDKIQSKVKKK